MRRLAVLLLLLLAPAARAQDAGYQGGPAHSGAVDAAVAPPLGKRWVVEGLGSVGTPIVHDGRVFVTARPQEGQARLHAFDAAGGAELWTALGVTGRISASGGRVYADSGSGVVARDTATGAVLWTAPPTDDGPNEPVADGDRVFVGNEYLASLEANTGLALWSYPHPDAFGGPAAAAGGLVYHGGCSGTLVARLRATGTLVWSQPTGGLNCAYQRPPAVAGGRVYGPGQSYDALTGLASRPLTGGMPAISGDTVVAVDGDNLVARDGQGRLLWETEPPPDPFTGGFAFRSAPLIVGATVFMRAGRDLVAGYDLATGKETWRSLSRGDDYDDPQPDLGLAAGGDRLVVPMSGKLIAYGPGTDTPGVDPDPWRERSAVTLGFTKLAARAVRFGRRVALQAQYTRRVGHDPAGGPVIGVEADPFPYGQWEPAGTTDTYLTARRRPQRNTRYRLRYDGVDPPAISRAQTVLVELPFRIRYRYLSRTRLRARATLRGPQEVLAARRGLAYYFYRRSKNRSTRLALTRFDAGGRKTTVLHVPRAFGRRDVVFGCVIERSDDGFGRFRSFQRSCGRRRIG